MAAKTFETVFKIGGKYAAGPAFRALNTDLDKTKRHARDAGTHLKNLHTHIGKFAAVIGATAAAYKLLSAATALWREGVEASKEAVDVQEKLEMSAVRMSKKYGESSQKIIDSANATSKAISAIGFDFEDVQAGVTKLMASMGNTRQLQSFSQAFANITAKTKGARPGIEGWLQSAQEINQAILTGKGPLLAQLDWPDKQRKAFKALSVEQRRITLQEFARVQLAGEAVRASESTAGALAKEAIARENVAQALAGGSVEQQKKMAETMEKFWKSMEPIAGRVGAKIAEFFEQWAKILEDHGPEMVKSIEKIADAILWATKALDWILSLKSPKPIFDLPAALSKLWADTKKEIDWIIAAISADWERIKAMWNAAPKWFDENVIKKLAALWDWLIGNSYMVDGAQRGWDEIKKIWGGMSDWFYDHVIKPIAAWWDWLWRRGVPVAVSPSGYTRGAQATAAGRSGYPAAAGGGVTAAGGGEPGSTGPNAAIEAERAAVMEELKDPQVRSLVAATIAQEQGSAAGRADVLEALINRAVVQKKSLRSLVTGGFYGPFNRGTVSAALHRGMSPEAMEEFDRIAEEVRKGRNAIRGAVDQGQRREVAAAGRMMVRGEAYGFWGRRGETSTAAYRAGHGLAEGPTKTAAKALTTATKMVKEKPKSTTPYNAINPYPGQPGLQGPATLSPGASLRQMLQPINMRGRTSGAVPQNIAMSPTIHVHGVSADRVGAVGDEVVKAMQDPSRRLIAQMKKSRSDELRLNLDA